MKYVSNTNNFTAFLSRLYHYRHYSVLMLSYHTSLFPLSLCLFPSILKSLDVVPYSWDHLQSWPAPPSPLPVGEIQGYTHITHSLRSELISGIFNKTRYVDTEEGAAMHPALDFKTATGIIFQRIERLEIAWLQR